MPRAFRAHPRHPAIEYLARLHGDLGGQILANRKEQKRLAEAMRHVEAVIRLFDPAYDVRRIAVRRRVRKNRWFKRGHMFRAVVDVLKAADKPMTVRELTLAVLAGKGETAPDLKTIRDLAGGIRSTISRKAGKTIVNVGQGMPSRWRLAEPVGH